jgi:intracellular sulfur oxidation DsrE/DsrF family protein
MNRMALVAAAVVLSALSPDHTRAADPMTTPTPAGHYAFQKVVYQNDGGLPDDRAYFDRELHNIANHITAVDGKAEIRVVNWGPGLKPFQMAKADPALAALIDSLRAKGVRFLICRNSLKAMNLKPEDLYGVRDGDVVPSGVAELARLQGLGFVYIHP